MAIPALTTGGELPSGEHKATLAEIEKAFGGPSPKRADLMAKLKLAAQNFKASGVKTIWIDGSFTTSKVDPNDIDGCWAWNSSVNRAILDPVFLNKSRAPMKAKYGLDFFIAQAIELGSGLPFPKFFQKNRNGDLKGILVVEIQ